MTEALRSVPELPQSKEKYGPFKALILDVDGTIVNGRHALPSKRVIETVVKASKILHVGIATSRPLFEGLVPIISKLQLSGPSIIHAGAAVIDSRTSKVLWKKNMLEDAIKMAHAQSVELGVNFFFTSIENNLPFSDLSDFNNILGMWAYALEPKKAMELIDRISNIPTITPVKVPSWEKGKEDVVISHSEATKQHGIFEVGKILGISTHEIIGVGDGYNDFPLLMACGLKIAMGNAVPDLKEIADYTAPTVEEDGVAAVIERFIL